MVKLPLAALASVSLALTCVVLIGSVTQAASAASPARMAKDKVPKTGSSPNDRYDVNMVLPGSSREAVNICIAAAQKQGIRYGIVKNMDIKNVAGRAAGYLVHGRSLISRSSRQPTRLFGFRCVTRNGHVSAIRLSPQNHKD